MLNHFKMDTYPFAEQPCVDQLCKDERITQGLARLEYFLTQGVIALLLGQTGVGKSSLIRLFLHSLSRNRIKPIYLHLTNITAKGLLRLLVSALGEVPKIGKDRLFLQIMAKTQNELPTLLVFDEAHLLDPEVLTDIRLLVSGMETNQNLKIILSGQDPLSHTLKRSTHADLVQRINVSYYLRALTREQTTLYIDSRMRSSGASEKIFEPEAKSLIHDYAHGIPRQINNMATACLLNAVAKKEQKVTEAMVNLTISETFLP
ncbi:MAG: AAA family ATPase [Desulfovermiculus sp.]|nr:AAA family ATPase [Desulfovermiculus sp.]